MQDLTPPRLPVLHGQRLTLRPAEDADAPAITGILADPEVARWWGQNDLERVRDELREVPSYAIVVGGAVAGWLQVQEETEPDYPSVAFDIVVAPEQQGRGYGQEALRVAIRHFIARGHHRFTIDPAVENDRAIRCYRAVGFRPVGVLRAYDRAPDGTWRDGLLMDLLAADLTEKPSSG
jgi:aminoglycoside 6'-N-acetyltransferase